MINGFTEWASSERLIQSSPLEQLRGRCLAIDAEQHVRQILAGEGREALLPALGGTPFNLENTLDAQIAQFAEAGIKPLFVFHGISASGEQHKLVTAELQGKKIDQAWDLYNASNADQAVTTFGSVSTFDSEHIYRYIQALLHERKVPFLVAPYSAYAELAYMEGGVADAISGAPELLVFDVQRVVLNLDFDKKTFSWVTRQACVDNLALGNANLWIDACLLAGSNLLQTFPQLDIDATPTKSPRIKAAADLLKRMSMNGNAICLQYQDEPLNRQFDYLDNYRKALMSIQHHVITSFDGEMITLNKETAPNDVHTFIGQRLPDEIYYYVSRGAIGTSVLNWRTSGRIVEKPPVDGGTSATYQNLIRDKIIPQRVKALALLSQSLHRFYQHKDVTMRLFGGAPDSQGRELGVTEVGDVKGPIASWHVTQKAINDRLKGSKAPNLHFAINALSAEDFAKETITPKSSKTSLMAEKSEIQGNALWRYLQLSEYVTKEHTLSSTGQLLHLAYTAAQAKGLEVSEFAEPLLLGMELFRHRLLSPDGLFPVPPYHGAPIRGTDIDLRHTLLVSRVACLGRLKHAPIGYTGPLSRHLLAYKSLISVIRQSQRDMLDMCLCTMFVDGDIDRNIKEHVLKDVSFGLPFLKDNDCGLGLAVRHYLDELSAQAQPTSKEARSSTKAKGSGTWFPHVVDYAQSLDYAFSLWDALTEAVKQAPDGLVSGSLKEEWVATDKWLRDRR